MKKINLLFMALITTIAMCSFTACSDDENPSPSNSDIIERWRQINEAGTVITVKFNSDQTGTINFTFPDGSGDSNENFEYDYQKQERDLTIIGSSLNGRYDITITASKLRLEKFDIYYEFTKVK